MDLAEQCTVIVVTHNRAVYLKRLLSYLESVGIRYRLLIADTSDADVRDINLGIISGFRSAFVLDYVSFDSELHYMKVHAEAASICQTPFVTYCADDDFASCTFIQAAVEFLLQNASYSCCNGRYALLFDKNYMLQSNIAYTNEDVLDRFCFAIRNVSPVSAGLWRREAASFSYGLSVVFPKRHFLQEILASIACTLYGKVEVLDKVSFFHNIHSGGTHQVEFALELASLGLKEVATSLHLATDMLLSMFSTRPYNELLYAIGSAVIDYLAGFGFIYKQGVQEKLHSFDADVTSLKDTLYKQLLYRWEIVEFPRTTLTEASFHSLYHDHQLLQAAFEEGIYRNDAIVEERSYIKGRWAAALLSADFITEYCNLKQVLGFKGESSLFDWLLTYMFLEDITGCYFPQFEAASYIAERLGLADEASEQAVQLKQILELNG